jgi:hypothetical protein
MILIEHMAMKSRLHEVILINVLISRKGEEEYTSSKRSEIPHLFDEISNR